MKKIITTLLFQALCLVVTSQEVQKETYTYSTKGSDTLKMDRYYADYISSPNKAKPTIIFMFGGSFRTGARDKAVFIPCFEYYATRGHQVFSIDYRLGLKDVKFTEVKQISKLIELITNTIDIAVEDLYDATTYIVNNSKEWNIDPETIVTLGSSAGAISVLQAEYYRTINHPLSNKLPKEFKYGGVIGMAGAIFTTNGALKWGDDVAPLLLFHGNADNSVPYEKAKVLKYGLYGSQAIVKSLHKIDKPYYFYSFIGESHRIAVSPMNQNREDINAFLSKLVIKKETLEITKVATNIKNPKKRYKYSLGDYIKANFLPSDAGE